jgi:hypothetical protein
MLIGEALKIGQALLPSGASFMVVETQIVSVKI